MKVDLRTGNSYNRTSTNTEKISDLSPLILRWTEPPGSESRELPVEMVQNRNSGSIVRISLRINEATPVSLLGRHYMVNGIVRSCRAENDSFLLTIESDQNNVYDSYSMSGRDPGSLVVDDFLTEEEEAKILESLQESASRSLLVNFLYKVARLAFSPFCPACV